MDKEKIIKPIVIEEDISKYYKPKIIKPIFFEEDMTKYSISPNQNDLFDALALEGIFNKREKWITYRFNEQPVPRVTKILQECIGRDYLMMWAAKLGSNYKRVSQETFMIGNLVHESIEYFLEFNAKKDIFFRSNNVEDSVNMAYNNFLDWYDSMQFKGYTIKPLMIEAPVVCPWYGGTIDCIMSITKDNISKNFLVDFKSSKSLSIDYLLQTYAYSWAIKFLQSENIYNDFPKIDGIGVIRVDKDKVKNESIFINFDNLEQQSIISDLDNALGSMINWYYHTINLNYDLTGIKKFPQVPF